MQANPGFVRPAAALALLALLGAVPAYAADVARKSRRRRRSDGRAAAQHLVRPLCRRQLGYGFSGHDHDPDHRDRHRRLRRRRLRRLQLRRAACSSTALEGDVGYSNIERLATAHRVRDSASTDRCAPAWAWRSPTTCCSTPPPAAPRQSLKISDPAGSDRKTMLGWTAGGGVDVKLTEQVFGRVEYRYTDFGSPTSTPAAASSRSTPTRTASASASA